MNAVVSEVPVDGTAAAAGGPSLATVLCVDDEPNILSSLKRVLRSEGLCVMTATSGPQALAMMEQMPFDLVISDMRMPGMDGAQLLEQVHQRWAQVVRILLTGHADIGSTVAAINRGRIFRYITKPWDEPELLGAVRQGLQLQKLERERARLEALTQQQNLQLQTLNDELEQRVSARTQELKDANVKIQRNYLKSIKVFSNLLELRDGTLAGHGRRVAETARDIARKMELPDEEQRQIFIAGLLHDVGLMGMADKVLAKPVVRYTDEEMALYREHATRGEQSLMALDDMQPVMSIIRSHHERWDGQGFPDKHSGTDIPLGARILAVADAYDDLQNGFVAGAPVTPAEARTLMRQARGLQFDPEVLDVFLHISEPQRPVAEQKLMLGCDALEPDMVLGSDLISGRGVLMLTAGHRLTPALIRRIREFQLREGSKLELHIRPRGAA
ncbi:HD domain-containing phosphohydrolase [Aquabacterium sp.]|uniref:HD domain-containing phosphohydrolase n=1 Tax=Aquabacterium sp. TaxID=1872578 RepID=UPI002C8DBC75|nr:HD domain-containing phosphohydrolase [Aquabacterium sp.]HSW04478.1 HD domain-containing phosphohydrolase [Aquabacterium sp.]